MIKNSFEFLHHALLPGSNRFLRHVVNNKNGVAGKQVSFSSQIIVNIYSICGQITLRLCIIICK